MKHVLITGGAGFIGSHVADLLVEEGYQVRLLDNLGPQVHSCQTRPDYLTDKAELLIGDVRDKDVLRQALRGIDSVIHLAASVGVGQSMYEMVSYTDNNEVGTASLLEIISRNPVEKLVCASSMSVYGEGLTQRKNGEPFAPDPRPLAQLRTGDWELREENGDLLTPLPTPETKQPSLSSVYALNKFAQETLCLLAGSAYGIPTIALRFFNVYGPRQSLSNPYTGVLAIFAARLLNGRPPLIFEDGGQRRDFVHVSDVARACLLALQGDAEGVFNVGSGESRSITSIARDLAGVVGRPDIVPHVIGKYRTGDIRHCFADVSKSVAQLDFSPQVTFDAGLRNLAEWLAENIAVDGVEQATAELEQRGLVA